MLRLVFFLIKYLIKQISNEFKGKNHYSERMCFIGMPLVVIAV